MVPGRGWGEIRPISHPGAINSFIVMRPNATIKETKLSQESVGLGDKSSINYIHKAISLRESGMRQKETTENPSWAQGRASSRGAS